MYLDQCPERLMRCEKGALAEVERVMPYLKARRMKDLGEIACQVWAETHPSETLLSLHTSRTLSLSHVRNYRRLHQSLPLRTAVVYESNGDLTLLALQMQPLVCRD